MIIWLILTIKITVKFQPYLGWHVIAPQDFILRKNWRCLFVSKFI